MALLNLTNLDFDQIKVSIIDYLKSNSDFTDYDFEGSNLSTIIDVLAYNTYISSYNANMVSNECFIDSATLRENVDIHLDQENRPELKLIFTLIVEILVILHHQ